MFASPRSFHAVRPVLPPSEDHWYTTMQRLWPEFVPMPLSDEDNHPCSLTAIFSDQYPAAFYSIKWSEVSEDEDEDGDAFVWPVVSYYFIAQLLTTRI